MVAAVRVYLRGSIRSCTRSPPTAAWALTRGSTGGKSATRCTAGTWTPGPWRWAGRRNWSGSSGGTRTSITWNRDSASSRSTGGAIAWNGGGYSTRRPEAGLLDGGREDHEVVAIHRTIGRRARCDEGGEWRLADRTEGSLWHISVQGVDAV